MREEYEDMYAFLRRYYKDNAEILRAYPHMTDAVKYAITSFNHRGDSFSGWLDFVNRFVFPYRVEFWKRQKEVGSKISR